MKKIKNYTNMIDSKPSWVDKFLWWCAGAEYKVLIKIPSEYKVYSSMGVIILITAFLAGISGGYAIFTVFHNYYFAVAFGLFWGFIIFSIDRLFVISFKKSKLGTVTGFIHNLLKVSPRLILAILLGIVISMPLELKIFETEISKNLINIESQKRIDFMESAPLYKINQLLEKEIQNLKKQQASIAAMESRAYTETLKEINGQGQTSQKGYGPEANFHRGSMEIYKNRYESISLLIEDKEESLGINRDRLEDQMTDIKYQSESPSLLTRIEGLNHLKGEIYSFNWWVINTITLLFILFEIAPVSVKLLLAKGNYDKNQLALAEDELYISSELRTEIKEAHIKQRRLEIELRYKSSQMDLLQSIKELEKRDFILQEAKEHPGAIEVESAPKEEAKTRKVEQKRTRASIVGLKKSFSQFFIYELLISLSLLALFFIFKLIKFGPFQLEVYQSYYWLIFPVIFISLVSTRFSLNTKPIRHG